MKNLIDLTGKIALITGASSGIGAATTELFAELGASVAFTYHNNQQGGREVEQRVQQTGARVLAMQADVRQTSELERIVSETETKLGPIDVLVNNAGSLLKRTKIAEMTEELWDDVLNLNLRSAMTCSRLAARSMAERKTGSIINIVSIAGRNGGGPGASAYATAKGGLITFTKGLAKEFASQGIRVNGVSPGVIDTPFHEVFSTPEMIRNFVTGIPMGRVGTSAEVAAVIAFLGSRAASYITGETIEVNGGQLML